MNLKDQLPPSNLDEAKMQLTQLKNLGVSIALDDFDTGYSALSYLTKSPIDMLKIDAIFYKNWAVILYKAICFVNLGLSMIG
ncbi:EAL domain-containing protein [Pseudoalteromonas aurantia]|uniref:EAL domain-containing protein n=1 Tax=Pseudoalteromonas aurantia TaxID=43654 RepID=UPI001BB107DD